MPSPSRSDLQDAAVSYFAELAAELDRNRAFPLERLDEELGWNIELSRDRIGELDAQLRANTFDDRTKQRASHLTSAGGWALEDLGDREKLFAFELTARAEREQMQRLVHLLSHPHRRYSPEDPLFEQQPESVPSPVSDRAEFTRQPSQSTLRTEVASYISRQTLRKLGASQIEELSRALTWLREELGDAKSLASIRPSDLRTFRDDIARLDATLRGVRGSFKDRLTNVPGNQIKSVTARRYWRSVQAFFAWCAAEQVISSDPAVGLKLDMKKGQRSRTPPPFAREELEKLFETPLYAGYQSANRLSVPGTCVRREGHWWSGVLFLFTGLRAGELSQLLPEDFSFDAEIPHLKVRDVDDQGRVVKTTKNEASARDVPIASELLELGLREFVVQRVSISPNARVFREFRLGTNGRTSDGLTKFWAAYLRKFDLWKPGRSTHVFRHTIIAYLRANRATGEDIAALVGHTDGSMTARYGGA